MISISWIWKYLFGSRFPYIEGILFACSVASTIRMVQKEMRKWLPFLVVVTVVLAGYFILKLAKFLV
ncbi:TPA: hypothetical protein QCU33_005389 [Bacillus cereus]|nr:hypothetical protein [Bacillus cereus]